MSGNPRSIPELELSALPKGSTAFQFPLGQCWWLPSCLLALRNDASCSPLIHCSKSVPLESLSELLAIAEKPLSTLTQQGQQHGIPGSSLCLQRATLMPLSPFWTRSFHIKSYFKKVGAGLIIHAVRIGGIGMCRAEQSTLLERDGIALYECRSSDWIFPKILALRRLESVYFCF